MNNEKNKKLRLAISRSINGLLETFQIMNDSELIDIDDESFLEFYEDLQRGIILLKNLNEKAKMVGSIKESE